MIYNCRNLLRNGIDIFVSLSVHNNVFVWIAVLHRERICRSWDRLVRNWAGLTLQQTGLNHSRASFRKRWVLCGNVNLIDVRSWVAPYGAFFYPMLRCDGQCNLVFKYFSKKRKKGLERKQNKYSDYVAERKLKGWTRVNGLSTSQVGRYW